MRNNVNSDEPSSMIGHVTDELGSREEEGNVLVAHVFGKIA